MKESLKEYLLTPKKEVTKDSDAEELRTSLSSDRKINQNTCRQSSSGHKQPFRKNHQNLSLNGGALHQGNQTYFMGTMSPCYSSSNDPSSVILQIPSLNQHQMLTSEAQDFSPLKQGNKLPSIIGSTTLHALSSTNPFKYNVFNSSCGDSPMHSYLQTCPEQQQQSDNGPQFTENNQLIKLACENITVALRKDNPLLNGSIILRKPRFYVEFQDKNLMKEFQDSDYQKEVIRQLDFSNSFFCYDIPLISNKSKHTAHSKKSQKSNENAKQSDQVSQILNPSSKVSSSSSQYYGYPFPGYYVDPTISQMHIQPRVLRNDDKTDKLKSTTNKLSQIDKSGKPEETTSKIGKVLFKPNSVEEILYEGEAQIEGHCEQTTKHHEIDTENNNSNHKINTNQQAEKDSVQIKSELSTVKKSKNEDILNQKRRHFDTPNSKKYDISTPSTKKKCLEEQSSHKQAQQQAFTAALDKQENGRKVEMKQQLSEDKQNESDNEDEDESYQEEVEDLGDENCSGKKECCGCKKTKCLKLYCECFQAKRYCVGTNCQGCHNRPEFEGLRQQAMELIQQRNTSAFEPKVDKIDEVFENTNGQKIHSKGCNCKKSDCRKKYCECFQMGAKCTHLCKCQNCKNGSSSSAIDQNAHPIYFVDGNTHPPHFRGHAQQPYCYYPPQRYGSYGQQWNHHHFYQSQDVMDQKNNRESDFIDYEDSHQQQPDPAPKFSNKKIKTTQNKGVNAIPLLEGTDRVQ